MYFFRNDYSEGALPEVMDALQRTNLDSTVGYGLDPYCMEAAGKIRDVFHCPDADVHFLVGGTQTNFTAITAFLRPWEAVITADSGHIATHETGAVEARGHKVCTVCSPDGKLRPKQICDVFLEHQSGADEHMVLPRLVYLSNSTELGTVYTKAELSAISEVCRQLNMYLYLDGARLPVALTCPACDIQAEDYPRYCDAFYIGGTKNGLLLGEALVIVRDAWKPNFRHAIKQNGGMLAKGRLLGVQFSALLSDDLWLRTARYANEMAAKLDCAIRDMGFPMLVDSPTNQIFPILENDKIAILQQSFNFQLWRPVDAHHTAIRFVTSWSTRQDAVDALLAALRDLRP